jgi:hypothetical protein
MEFIWALIYEHVKPSVFSVIPWPSIEEQHRAELTNLATVDGTVHGVDKLREALQEQKIKDVVWTVRSTTGFSVGGVGQGQGIAILTCAHGLSDFFMALCQLPRSKSIVSSVYMLSVTTTKMTLMMLEAISSMGKGTSRLGEFPECVRGFMPMLTNATHLRRHDGDVCNEERPGMVICTGDPRPSTSQCLMVSSPRLRTDLMSQAWPIGRAIGAPALGPFEARALAS